VATVPLGESHRGNGRGANKQKPPKHTKPTKTTTKPKGEGEGFFWIEKKKVGCWVEASHLECEILTVLKVAKRSRRWGEGRCWKKAKRKEGLGKRGRGGEKRKEVHK